MGQQQLRLTLLGLLAAVALVTAAPAQAGRIVTYVSGDGLEWSTHIPNNGADLKVAGPNGFYQTEHADSLGDLHYNQFPEDGLYQYELTLLPVEHQTRSADDNAAPQKTNNRGHKTSGTVRIADGLPIDPNAAE